MEPKYMYMDIFFAITFRKNKELVQNEKKEQHTNRCQIGKSLKLNTRILVEKYVIFIMKLVKEVKTTRVSPYQSSFTNAMTIYD